MRTITTVFTLLLTVPIETINNVEHEFSYYLISLASLFQTQRKCYYNTH